MAIEEKERSYYTMRFEAKSGERPFSVGVLMKAEVKTDVLEKTLETLFAEIPDDLQAMDVANGVKEAIAEMKPYGIVVEMGKVTHYWVPQRDYRYLIMAAFSGAGK